MWMYFNQFLGMFPAHQEDEGLISVNLCLHLPQCLKVLQKSQYVCLYTTIRLLILLCRKCTFPHKHWELIPLIQTQGVPDINATFAILDEIGQTSWGNSITCKSMYFNKKKFPQNLKINCVTQLPGDIIITLGAIHQGHGWVFTIFI